MDQSINKSILVVDDNAFNRMRLVDILGNKYDTIEAENGVQAIEIMGERTKDILLVILDIVMPEMDGYEVLAKMNKEGWIDYIPVIMVSGEDETNNIKRAYDLGATEFISKSLDDEIVHKRVANAIEFYRKQRHLTNMISKQLFAREHISNLMVNILSHIVEFRNGESGLHVLHIGTITEILLNKLMGMEENPYELTRAEVAMISTASALHDIGKISIPEEVLNKPGRLTDEEFEIIKQHSAVGAEMLADLPFHNDEKLVTTAHDICRWHHERWDGGGYPDGLCADEIPISAQVVALADVYDALTSERVYKPAYSHEKAVDMILGGECGAFNPLLLDCLLESRDEIKDAVNIQSLTGVSERELNSMAAEIDSNEFLSDGEKADMLRDIWNLANDMN